MEQNHITSSETSDISSTNIETYKFDKREYIVEPVYKDTGSETVASKLLRLMKSESEKH
jgi:hypothetical protein